MRGGRKYISKLESVIPKISRNVEQTHENMVHSRVCSFWGILSAGVRIQGAAHKVQGVQPGEQIYIGCTLAQCSAVKKVQLGVSGHALYNWSGVEVHCGVPGARCSQLVPAVQGSCPQAPQHLKFGAVRAAALRYTVVLPQRAGVRALLPGTLRAIRASLTPDTERDGHSTHQRSFPV